MWRKLSSSLKVLFWVVLVGTLVLFMGFKVAEKIRQQAMSGKGEPVYAVDVTPAGREDWEVRRNYYGQVKTVNSQNVTSYVREIVQEVHVRVGDHVKKGQTLVTLSSQNYRLDMAAVQANYDDARREYERLSALAKSGGVSKAQVEQAQSKVKEEQAKLQASRTTVNRTQVQASLNGVVSARMVEPGEVAEPGKPLLTVVDIGALEVDFMVSRRDIRSVAKDMPVEVVTQDGTERGMVKRVSPEAAAGSGLYPVLVGLPADSKVLPGTYLEGRFLVEHRENVIVVPTEVVLRRGEEAYVYVVDQAESRARARTIVPGDGQDGRVIVESGLNDGDLVVTRGFNLLSDGAAVKIADTRASETTAADERAAN